MIERQLDGKVAFVTGGGGGIGEAVVRLLSRHGATVIVNDIDADRARALAEELTHLGEDARPLPGDVVDPLRCAQLTGRLLSAHGAVDIVVNNAASMVDLGQLWTMTDREIAAGMSSFTATVNVLRALLPSMIERGRGRIVNIGSMAGRVPIAQMPIYSAAKGAIHSLTAALAVDLAPFGITINALAPGVIDTARQRARPAHVREARAREIPMGRLGTPQEVAEAVLFLCGPGSLYITGEVLPIDGGVA